MKRIIQTLILSVCSILAFGQTNEYMVLEQADGTVQKLNINDVVRITFENEGNGNSVIDETFIPSLTDILGVWNGEYEGWDVLQQATTKIKRELTLYPNGTYTNNLQGAMGTRTEYVDFEREAGTYSYDSQTQMVTYTALTDSLIDFRTHQLTSSTKDAYQEKAQFSYVIDGQRLWYLQDKNLVSADDEGTPVTYYMRRTGEVVSPTVTYFEKPYAQWDATPDAVKSEMANRGYTLYDEGTNSSGLRYLAYLGEQKEATSIYRFNAQQILAEIDIAFFDVTVEELEEFVTTQWGYTLAGKGSDGEDVYATPDKNSYVFIYSSTLSDGTPVSYVDYIKRASASAKSLAK